MTGDKIVKRSFVSVSVITPTTEDRTIFNENITKMYLNQTFDIKEHIMLYEDGNIGMKRNKLCEIAKSDIIVHMDSDDYYAPDFVSKSVQLLITSGADLVGLANAYFYDKTTERSWEYDYTHAGQRAVLGATMCYWRKTWEHHKFEDVNEGEDSLFCAKTLKVAYGDYKDSFVAIRHGNNTGRISYVSKEFKKINNEVVRGIMNL